MNVLDLAELAKKQLSELIGLKPLTIIGACKEGEGWKITLDMLEMSRIPPSTDVLGEYETVLDNEGNMLRFVRTRTRLRCEPIHAREAS